MNQTWGHVAPDYLLSGDEFNPLVDGDETMDQWSASDIPDSFVGGTGLQYNTWKYDYQSITHLSDKQHCIAMEYTHFAAPSHQYPDHASPFHFNTNPSFGIPCKATNGLVRTADLLCPKYGMTPGYDFPEPYGPGVKSAFAPSDHLVAAPGAIPSQAISVHDDFNTEDPFVTASDVDGQDFVLPSSSEAVTADFAADMEMLMSGEVSETPSTFWTPPNVENPISFSSPATYPATTSDLEPLSMTQATTTLPHPESTSSKSKKRINSTFAKSLGCFNASESKSERSRGKCRMTRGNRFG
jgi:hypothetical protein